MSISVHTNKSALTALENLNKTNDELAGAQNRINTGLKIANAKDSSKHGGQQSGKGGDSSQGGTTAQKKKAGRKGGKASHSS